VVLLDSQRASSRVGLPVCGRAGARAGEPASLDLCDWVRPRSGGRDCLGCHFSRQVAGGRAARPRWELPHTPEVIPWPIARASARAVNEANHQDSVMTSHMPGGKPAFVV